MKDELDWEPDTSLDEGLRRVYEYAQTELEGPKTQAAPDGGEHK
jgi:hypothetical protein